ncbi:TIGR01777 family oxidoreductase [Frigoriglobus tundricola]|uniref:Cell division inhibitor SulA n=1 Tax=Frigoriglobus tundricola TaxID=2774151 RepID=A0A6M5YTQ2_9BACT|nr:TIGR01777 family oxidoreductase [Frigoriglobus tundricola]QJW96703.1 Cell division inhibitor SulA [Frigoriglobus tundricola]
MKIVIPGGSGQVGTILARHFHHTNHDVVVLSRTPAAKTAWRVVAWDAQTVGPWAAEFEGADAVINLAGRSVNCRYTPANRREIIDSRVRSTHLVGTVIAGCARPPRVWLQASTATIYAHRFDAANDERTGALGGAEPNAPGAWNFSVDVATAWEKALGTVATPRTRKVAVRSAMTMSADRGGVFDVLLGLVRRRLGGRAGDGKQFVSWVHEADFIAATEFLIARDDMSGPVNVSAPEPLPNADFMRALRDAWGVRFGLPAARWMVGLGAWALRTESELVLKSRRVVPGRLMAAGFTFRFPEWPAAARDLCGQWRERARA